MNVTRELIEKYNKPVPRYTSYPPANHFIDSFVEYDYLNLIRLSNSGKPEHIAIYIHIPFCKKICFYCGCNACSLKKSDQVDSYIKALKKEISIVSALINRTRKVSQIHYGGGTPNAINISYLEEINQLLFDDFSFIDSPEVAIECNPAYLDLKYIERLKKAGFNRFSLGIQDFDNSILKMVNREPSAIPVAELISEIRNNNSEVSVNLDFIYGLPGQTVKSFVNTIQKAIDLKPNRLVTFSYAHVPWMKKHQQILEKRGLPSPDLKMEMFLSSRKLLKDSGYIPVGLDHYVLPGDELNIAIQKHQLHRNFQGYCTRRTTGQVYAFGVSAISQLERGFSQNFKEVDDYIEILGKGILPVEKGITLSDDQIIIKDLITEIMCNYRLDLNDFAQNHFISISQLKQITQFNDSILEELIEDNLVEYKSDIINVTETGGLFIRNIAACFDPQYMLEQNKYSKTV